MTPTYSLLETPPEDRAAMTALLREYYHFIVARIDAAGGPAFDIDTLLQDYWDNAGDFLPPRGATVLAHDAQGALLGCGMLKAIGPTRGELKRLFVRDAARGHGVGRRLVEMRIDAARAMGLWELLVDTLRNNHEMLGLYTSLGFEKVPPFPESTTYDQYPDLGRVMVFLKRRL
ncbi:GNAT family N-acetyltransferase [Oceanibium sediminis]|uniref:GNAT family N-acetyltransferase n=1 Tax=Oceanibium sediminis TaxID=2026339 RepID=UPI000DD46DD3|nr:GNAT family N-acetyltransferase [Oceanibium sediminis]